MEYNLTRDLDGTPPMPQDEFLAYGMGQVAYLRPTVVLGRTVYTIHAANGVPIAALTSESQAQDLADQHDIRLIQVQ